MKPWIIVFRKELKDLFRDRRTISLLSIPVLLLFLSPLAFFFAAFARTVKEAQTYLGLLVLAAMMAVEAEDAAGSG